MVEPYLEALSFIKNNKDIKKQYGLAYKKIKNKNLKDLLEEYIDEKINNKIYNYDSGNEEDIDKKIYIEDNPQGIFDYILNDLHELFKGKKNNKMNKEIQSAEINDEQAKKVFEQNLENDKSIISELFYGKKYISKYCKICKMSFYSYEYQKNTLFIDLNEYMADIELEKEIKSKFQKKYKKKEFCSICSSKQKFEIIEKIKEKPKIMIIVIKNYNNLRVNFKKRIFNNNYELIGLEVSKTQKSNIFGLFFRCFKPLPITYQFLTEDDIDMSKIIRERPFVLYYQKIDKKKAKNISTKKQLIDDIKSNDKFDVDNKNNIIISKKKSKKLKQINSSINEEIKKDNNIINENNENEIKKDIILYFRFIKTEKELYIDTLDDNPFKEIISKLKKKYHLEQSINNIEFNGKKLNINKNPRFYGIQNESTIIVKN